MATTLTNCVDDGDFVARLGGDEFAIIQANVGRPEESGVLANRIIERLAAPYEIEGQQLNIGASIGLAIAPTDGKNADQLLKNADLAMYRAKADGRGSYCFFEAGNGRSHSGAARARTRAAKCAWRRASCSSTMSPWSTPRTARCDVSRRCCAGSIRGLAPSRPANSSRSPKSPGLIGPLGQWVLRSACAEAAKWPSRFRVAVNLSPIQFKNLNLVKGILGALAASGLPASRLELEITESVLLEADARTIAILHELHSLGIRIVMDDFGTGFSSLNYLRSFPFDKIKIDKTFVRDMSKGGELGRDHQRRSSIWGVRSILKSSPKASRPKSSLRCLMAEGCIEMQGYYFSKPAPIERFEKILTERNGRHRAAPA